MVSAFGFPKTNHNQSIEIDTLRQFNSLLLKINIEFVDLPINNGDFQ